MESDRRLVALAEDIRNLLQHNASAGESASAMGHFDLRQEGRPAGPPDSPAGPLNLTPRELRDAASATRYFSNYASGLLDGERAERRLLAGRLDAAAAAMK